MWHLSIVKHKLVAFALIICTNLMTYINLVVIFIKFTLIVLEIKVDVLCVEGKLVIFLKMPNQFPYVQGATVIPPNDPPNNPTPSSNSVIILDNLSKNNVVHIHQQTNDSNIYGATFDI